MRSPFIQQGTKSNRAGAMAEALTKGRVVGLGGADCTNSVIIHDSANQLRSAKSVRRLNGSHGPAEMAESLELTKGREVGLH